MCLVQLWMKQDSLNLFFECCCPFVLFSVIWALGDKAKSGITPCQVNPSMPTLDRNYNTYNSSRLSACSGTGWWKWNVPCSHCLSISFSVLVTNECYCLPLTLVVVVWSAQSAPSCQEGGQGACGPCLEPQSQDGPEHSVEAGALAGAAGSGMGQGQGLNDLNEGSELARLFDVVHPRERQFFLLPDIALESHDLPALACIPPNPPQISVVEPSELAKSDIPEIRRLALRGEPMIQVVQTKGPFVVAVPVAPVNTPAQAMMPNVPPVNPLALVAPQCQVCARCIKLCQAGLIACLLVGFSYSYAWLCGLVVFFLRPLHVNQAALCV